MGGKNKFARVYLLEDINDNRYIGSTSELKLHSRLHTHRRDKKEYQMGVRKDCCSSMKLDLYHCSITELMVCKNIKDERGYWEKHYINNVYPECVNTTRFMKDIIVCRKNYYANNKEKIVKRNLQYRIDNREAYNKSRRDYYNKNKEAINAKRRQKTEIKRLENI